MKTLTIRGIDDQLANAIKKVSVERNESMNQTVIKLLRTIIGLSKRKVFPQYHDLDSLAGTWSVKEEQAFWDNTQSLQEIDQEMWE